MIDNLKPYIFSQFFSHINVSVHWKSASNYVFLFSQFWKLILRHVMAFLKLFKNTQRTGVFFCCLTLPSFLIQNTSFPPDKTKLIEDFSINRQHQCSSVSNPWYFETDPGSDPAAWIRTQIPDLDPALFVLGMQDAKKMKFILNLFSYWWIRSWIQLTTPVWY